LREFGWFFVARQGDVSGVSRSDRSQSSPSA
jgi:hypothetical protein